MPAIFPRWTNNIPIAIGLLAPLVGAGLIFAVWYWFSPKYTDVGYRPEQPVPYSHKLHAGDMGIDCRYCHNTVERAAHAAIPPTATCMNCHEQVKTESLRLRKVRESYQTGEPIPWIRVHQLPDYAYFDHSAHVGAGVGCASCHGRVDKMVVVEMRQPLSMGWCLDCHRNPTPNLRPLDQVTNMDWTPEAEAYDPSRDPDRKRQVNPPLHCSGCHR
ncbi:MAG: cytochrome c3 family protein [Myxococcales bacterium]|nr:cytochrome c3 family protein [Myxococcales bacterium]